MSPRPLSGALALTLALALLLAGGCQKDIPLAIEQDEGFGFDPLRFDFGPEPEGDIDESRALRFSITPFYTPELQQQMLVRIRGWLAEKVGVPVHVETSSSYASAVEGLTSGELDVAQLSPYACVKARSLRPDVKVIASAIAQGTATYASYLVVRADSDIERIQDAKGRRLAFTEPWSASGFLYPWAWLRRQGLSPAEDFQLVRLNTHNRALQALLDGHVDVTATSSDTLVSRGVLGLAGPVRIIAKTGRVPHDCVAVREGLSERLTWRVRRAFLQLSILTPEGRDMLREYSLINGFFPLPEGHYDDVRALDVSYGAEIEAVVPRLSTLEPAPTPEGKAP